MAGDRLPASSGPGDPRDTAALWRSFPHDPRDPANAPLRASDDDRDRIHRVLAAAFGDGRLDQVEFEERTDIVVRARTLGELPAVVGDLLPDPGPGLTPAARWRVTPSAERAVDAYRAERRQAVWGALSASIICWVIWWFTGHGFAWPVFVMLGTGMNALRVVFFREQMIADEQRRIERKDAKQLEKDQRRQLPGGDA